MKKQKLSIAFIMLCVAAAPVADIHAEKAGKGGISPEMMSRIRASYPDDATTKALRNALGNSDIDKIALNSEAGNAFDTNFSHRVKSKGITNQKSSGRCWLFTGLNVLRAQMMATHDLPELQLSQNYNFFYDQLEKANLFLQGIA